MNVKNREAMFGDIVNGIMILNGLGEIVLDCVVAVPDHFSDIEIMEFVVMPDHVHLVINVFNPTIKSARTAHRGQTIRRGQACLPPTDGKIKPNLKKLPVIVGSIKSSVTREIVKKYGYHEFQWQRSFHDRIIRGGLELYRIRQYIKNNPVKWEMKKAG